MFCVYVLAIGKSRRFYIGSTNNLKRRLSDHRKKMNFELLYYEAYSTEEKAREREKKIEILWQCVERS
ncbi:MAG: GIY-YIG nuclease family protein [Elusimicrobia bacterium]|nr:GIY-YIG nuclease family protein [Elusimicrobiota bacterium]